jgi:hypothetical protein
MPEKSKKVYVNVMKDETIKMYPLSAFESNQGLQLEVYNEYMVLKAARN